jgi:hypothetical protein
MRFIKLGNPCQRVAVEIILADELAVIFYDRNPGIELAFPVLASVDIVHSDFEPPAHDRQ